MAALPENVVASVRDAVALRGASSLPVSDLSPRDLELVGWVGSPLHVKSIATSLDRAARGEVDYLAVRSPSGAPVAVGGADHCHPRGPAMIWQLSTHEALRSLGIGTELIRALEDRSRNRGIETAWLSVETNNPRARALYERLGYEAFDEETTGWEQQDDTGAVSWYEARVTVMRRNLSSDGVPS